jgi:hypothetical protein
MQVEIRAVCPSAAGYSVFCSGDPRKAERHTFFREPATEGFSRDCFGLLEKRYY